MKFPDLYPHVSSVFKPSAIGRGPFVGGSPSGVTVHHTADRNLARVMENGVEVKEGYHLIIDRDGQVHQTTYFTQTVAHAGKATWFGKSPNRCHIAVAVLSWGRLSPAAMGGWKSWSGAFVKGSDVSFRPGNFSTGGNAYWDACTLAQEATLLDVLAWAIELGIDPAQICGHDECALPLGRKDDPGGVLSMTMYQLRTRLKANPINFASSPAKP